MPFPLFCENLDQPEIHQLNYLIICSKRYDGTDNVINKPGENFTLQKLIIK